jgi:hypothetical protein
MQQHTEGVVSAAQQGHKASLPHFPVHLLSLGFLFLLFARPTPAVIFGPAVSSPGLGALPAIRPNPHCPVNLVSPLQPYPLPPFPPRYTTKQLPLLKLKDWPPERDFKDALPRHYQVRGSRGG